MHEIPESNLQELILLLLRRRRRFRVTGASMRPTLEPGDEVLIDPRAVPRPGDIVVARHPFDTDVRMIKRVAAIDEAGRCQLAGDNSTESTDSRVLGGVPVKLVLGKVTSRLP